MTPTSSAENSGVVTGKRAERRRRAPLAREIAGKREHRDDRHEAAEQHRDAERRVVPRRVGGQPGERRAVVAGAGRVRVEDLAQPVRALVEQARGAERRRDDGDPGERQDGQREDQHGEHRHLHVEGLDLLAEVFRRPADHQAGDEDGQDDEDEDAVEPGADAAEDHLAEQDVGERDEPAERRERVVHRVHRAAARVGRHGREQRRVRDAEPHLLALHVAAGLTARSPADRRRRAAGCRAPPPSRSRSRRPGTGTPSPPRPPSRAGASRSCRRASRSGPRE